MPAAHDFQDTQFAANMGSGLFSQATRAAVAFVGWKGRHRRVVSRVANDRRGVTDGHRRFPVVFVEGLSILVSLSQVEKLFSNPLRHRHERSCRGKPRRFYRFRMAAFSIDARFAVR